MERINIGVNMKQPQRVFSKPENRASHIENEWRRLVTKYDAVVLKDGENPSDYPTKAVAYETKNFGWIFSKPNEQGKRKFLERL
jgi:hypothetical protein